jgi:hypothetical protein
VFFSEYVRVRGPLLAREPVVLIRAHTRTHKLHPPKWMTTKLFSFMWWMGIRIVVFWDMTPCNLVDRYQYFGEHCCLHLHGRRAIWNCISSLSFRRLWLNHIWRPRNGLSALCLFICLSGTDYLRFVCLSVCPHLKLENDKRISVKLYTGEFHCNVSAFYNFGLRRKKIVDGLPEDRHEFIRHSGA